jgi:hypothetical protein
VATSPYNYYQCAPSLPLLADRQKLETGRVCSLPFLLSFKALHSKSHLCILLTFMVAYNGPPVLTVSFYIKPQTSPPPWVTTAYQ